MEKLTLTISPEDWGSLITKYNADSKKVTLASFTQGTVNIDSDITGSITKREGNVVYNPIALPAAPKDQFEAIFSDGARHLIVVANGEFRYSSGDNVFNTVINGSGYSAVANFEFATTQDRVYGGNGVNSPIVYDRNTTYGGVVYTAPRIRTMGLQAPVSAPSVAVAAGGAVPIGPHRYKITYLYYDSEESNGSPASAVATTSGGNQTVNLTAIPVGGYGVTARKIYRDNNDGLYLHVGTVINNTATTFSDTLAVGATPTEIPEFNNAPPTFSLIVSWLDRQWLGKVPGDPYTLFYTETSMPDIVRPENELLCNQEDPITAYIVYFGRMIVFNRRSMGQILGTTSDVFRYSALPGAIGCVDNRTLQVRVINGVPILIWLSDQGFYSYDGNAINYISDEIEDLVNFNIQQALQQKNSNTQSSQTQFQGGTASNGIDLTSAPGSITTKGYADGTALVGTNPRRNFDDQADWESGSTQNLALRSGDNKLKAVSTFRLSSFPGTVTGDLTNSSGLRLTTSTDHTGSSNTGGTAQASTSAYTAAAQKITVPRAGTVTTVRVGVGAAIPSGSGPSQNQYRVTVWNDAGGIPGSIIFQSAQLNQPSAGVAIVAQAVSLPLPANGSIWIGITRVAGIPPASFVSSLGITSTSTATISATAKMFLSGSWQDINPAPFGATANKGQVSYVFSPTPISKNGAYTSTVYDSGSISLIQTFLTTSLSTLNTFGTKAYSVIVEASTDNLSYSQVFTSSVRSSLTAQSIVLTGQRYFRFKVTMSTTDDRETDTVNLLMLKYPTPVTWDSPVIDTTSDSVSYDQYSNVSSTSLGGTLVFQIATSANAAGPFTGSGNGDGQFGAFGSHIVRRYVKLRVIITMSASDPQQTPTVTSILFRWTLTSNLVSSIIDTAVVPPAGWDIFLASFTTNGGVVTFQMRSSASAGTIGAATFFTVTPGEFPTAVTPLQFVQWRVIITSSDNDVPTVDSVTIQWFIAIVNSIRPASIFTASRYYVALAALNQTTNNILLELDSNGKWRRHSGLNIATFSFFFNNPYFGLSTIGTIRRFLSGLTDAGAAIEFDVRFKASDFSTQYQNNSSKVKVVGEVILQGINTGATLQLFYSVDMGKTFYPLYTSSGSVNYVTTTDGENFYVRFRPVWDGSVPIAGRTITYKIYSNDVNSVEIKGLEATAFLRMQAPVITG